MEAHLPRHAMLLEYASVARCVSGAFVKENGIQRSIKF
jgi:hypothetical protein